MIDARRGGSRRLFAALALPFLVSLSACGGGSSGPCTTCPPPPPDTGTLSLEVGYEPAGDLVPAGFTAQDVDRVDVVVAGPNGQETRSLEAPTNRAAFDLAPGQYSVSASAFGDGVLLFSDASQATVVAGETVTVALEMEAELGTVTLQIDGQTSGTVNAVAGEGVPFVVTVRNSQGQPVPGSTVRITKSDPNYGQVAFDGANETDAQGRAEGTINAAFSGELTFSVEVDGRPISNPGATHIVFATGVAADHSTLGNPILRGPIINGFPIANGASELEYVVRVRNASGEALPGVPVTPTTNRNEATGMEIDLFEPANGFEDWKTGVDGTLRFTLRTFSSSFLHVENGRLTGEGNKGQFTPVQIIVSADGVEIGRHQTTFNSSITPNASDESVSVSPAVVNANGQDSATVTVKARTIPSLGGGPAANVYVELVDVLGNVLNGDLDISPAAGFDGFRTDATGVWKGEIRSNEPIDVFFGVMVDGRPLNLDPRASVFFE